MLDQLRSILTDYGSVCVGYSGGVDSVFLARIAAETLGPGRMLAVTGVSAAVPRVQLDVARECAAAFGIPHLEIRTDEVQDPSYAANPTNRCYFCKTELWARLAVVAGERGLAVLADGSNTDDVSDYRPGARAGAEHGVRSPLLEAGFAKADIREASRALGLPTWDQPAAPCLSSRVAYGVAITPARLRQVERAETAVRARGYREFRVRHHGDCARLEFAGAELQRAADDWSALHAQVLAAGFTRVLLDVDGYRRGALNAGLTLVQLKAAG